MPYPRFSFEPSYSSSGEIDLKQNELQFGDGYTQSSPLGINNKKRIYNLQFMRRTDAEIRRIRAFIEALNGSPFLWCPPPPDDYELWPFFVPGNSYTVGDGVRSNVNSTWAYVCVADNADMNLNSANWVFVAKLPLQFVCKKPNWAYEAANSTGITLTFEQNFTP
jgi:phage-related protein